MILFLLLVSLCSSALLAQDLKAKESLREGNSLYEEGDYEQALRSYEQANQYDSTYAKAAFNLGNAMYQQGNINEALGLFEEASELFVDKTDRSRAYHNMGRSHLQSALAKVQNMAATGGQPADQSQDPRPDLQSSLSEFKEALMLNPEDEEARYNYGYAKKLLEKLPPSQDQQQDQQGDEGEDQEKKEEQQDGEDSKNQEQEQEDQQDQEQQDQQQQEEKQQKEEEQQNQKPQDPNRMNAEQQLDLLDQEEKELQKQMSKQRMEGQKVRVEKDW